jgi:hypothetical protein
MECKEVDAGIPAVEKLLYQGAEAVSCFKYSIYDLKLV